MGGGRGTEASPRQEDPARREGLTCLRGQRMGELLSITRGLRIGWEYLPQNPKRQRQPNPRTAIWALGTSEERWSQKLTAGSKT